MELVQNKIIKKSDYKILIVDDDSAVLDFVNDILVDDEYTCFTATSGSDALNKLKEVNPDLIITDIKMPGITGVELVGNILQIDPEIQCIFMTGYADYEVVTQAINYHPIAYMDKPFTIDVLRRHVEKAFKEKQSIESDKAQTETLKEAVTTQAEDIKFRTERLLAEKELLHGIIAQANFGLIAVDTYYKVHMLNSYAIAALDINEQYSYSFQGLSFDEILQKDINEEFKEIFNKVLSNGKLTESESTLIENKKLSILAYPIVFKNNISAVVFVVHDITEKDELLKCLAQSAKLASIGELAAGVAHEINNPLGFVTSNITSLTKYITNITDYNESLCDTLSKCKPSDVVQDPIAKIEEIKKEYDISYIFSDINDLLAETKDGLNRVTKIVQDLKTFARAEDDTPQMGNINELIDNALNLVRNEIKYNLVVEKEFNDLPMINCFPNQLVQVFTNLFINASHAVKKDGILSIKTTLSDNKIKISVKDNGSGIPEKIILKIFDPFFTTKEPGKGTGMGLSISHSIIQKHNGELLVESTVGKGTVFTIHLPVRHKKEETDKTQKPQKV